MKLKILLPEGVLLVKDVSKVTAEGLNGSFCLLPRHIDFVAPLAPGILIFEDEEGREEFAAVNEGTLVKCKDEVLVSTRNGVTGESLETLRETVIEEFQVLNEHERKARSAIAKLEANFVKRFLEVEAHDRG